MIVKRGMSTLSNIFFIKKNLITLLIFKDLFYILKPYIIAKFTLSPKHSAAPID
jgi:hypothetical protein